MEKKRRSSALRRWRLIAPAFLPAAVLWHSFMLVSLNLQAFGVIFIGGWILVGVRAVFMFLAPALVRVSGLLAVIINLIIAGVTLFVTAIIGVFNALESLPLLSNILGSHKLSPFKRPEDVDPEDIRDFLTTIVDTCGSYNGIVPIWKMVVKNVASPAVCPVIRATYPLQRYGFFNIYKITRGLLGWLSYDSEPCVPQSSPIPAQPGHARFPACDRAACANKPCCAG